MKRKAQVLIIILWILVILNILAISTGHQVSRALKLSRYQRDKMRGLYLAKAGINRAIVEIVKDKQDCDSLQDEWADNKDIFEKIALLENADEFATVSYVVKKDDSEVNIYGVIDEERKINLNTAPQELLVQLFAKIGIENPGVIANNICAWRGDRSVTAPEYTELGYSNKGSKFINTEELILVKGIDQKIYSQLKELITVWGAGKVNVNTASSQILEIIINWSAKELDQHGVTETDPGGLLNRIIQLRKDNVAFASFPDLVKLGNLNSAQLNVLNKLEALEVADFKSSCFYIISSGKINQANIASIVHSVFERDSKTITILYWHES